MSLLPLATCDVVLIVPHPLRTGGIVPHVAGQLHHQNLHSVTDAALERSGCGMQDVSVVAVTVGPGLSPCLKEGLAFAKQLAQNYE